MDGSTPGPIGLSSIARGARLRRTFHRMAAIIDICTGTGSQATLRQYLDRPAISGFDDRGGAMGLLAAIEMYELH